MKPLSRSKITLGFHIHAFTFVVVMLPLVAINLWKGSPYWVLWVVLGWGIGLLSHWWFVLGPGALRNGITDTTRSALNSGQHGNGGEDQRP